MGTRPGPRSGSALRRRTTASLVEALQAEGPFINKAKVVGADSDTANGVIHVIDTVLIASLPGRLSRAAPTSCVGAAPSFRFSAA